MTLPRVSVLHPEAQFHSWNQAALRLNRGGLAAKPRQDRMAQLPVFCTPRATLTRLYDREKFGMVRVRTATLS